MNSWELSYLVASVFVNGAGRWQACSGPLHAEKSDEGERDRRRRRGTERAHRCANGRSLSDALGYQYEERKDEQWNPVTRREREEASGKKRPQKCAPCPDGKELPRGAKKISIPIARFDDLRKAANDRKHFQRASRSGESQGTCRRRTKAIHAIGKVDFEINKARSRLRSRSGSIGG